MRVGEVAFFSTLLDRFGFVPGLDDVIWNQGHTFGYFLCCMAASLMFDVFQAAVSPDLTVEERPCGLTEPELNLQGGHD